MRVALVHDWLTGMRGGEKILECLCEIYPEADIFTLLYLKGKLSPAIENRIINTSFIQKLPLIKTRYRNYLPLFPTAIEKFDLRDYDLVISTSHCVAKGVITPPHICHISYILTPMRYVWDMYHEYFSEKRLGKIMGSITPLLANYLRMWDIVSSNRVNFFVAISRYVAERVRRFYGRQAEVIYPPVNTDFFKGNKNKENFYLMVSALAPYKRVDLAIESFNRLRWPLKIIGLGPEKGYLKSIARSNIEFLGWQPDGVLKEYYSRAKGFIFPGIEDFGITPLEAQASGTPVIAFGQGGVLETLIPVNSEQPLRPEASGPRAIAISQKQTPTGLFFYEQKVEALCETLRRFEKIKWDYEGIRNNALRFNKKRFKREIRNYIQQKFNYFSQH